LVLSLEITLIALAAVVLLPVAVLCAECLAAALPGGRRARGASGDFVSPRPRVAVLIPAHNEEAGLPETLASIRPQMRAGDRVVVVADHCDDDTAGVARAAGCEVVERNPSTAAGRGKGYALDAGLKHLAADPPGVVVMVDADCRVEPASVDALARRAAQTGGPVQSAYVMAPSAAGGRQNPRQLVSVLAILLKNYVRPRGLARLGCPCLLTGSGMAFPWDVIRAAPLASGNIVEDMQLGLDLAMAGHPAVFCEEARITSLLPERDEAAARQRRRWEHGHINTLLNQVPRLVWSGVARGRLMSLPLALELAVPPLSLLAAVLAAALAASALVAAATPVSWTAAVMLLIGAACLVACALLTWWRFGRGMLPFGALLSAPWYVLWKAPIYASFLRRREKQWQRTERAPASAPPPSPAPAAVTDGPVPRPAPRDPKEEPADVAAGA
jgi:cellulose synthase/poly-beta-1,6-N-acetylglucosamine synthase-like glycosyltransferase